MDASELEEAIGNALNDIADGNYVTVAQTAREYAIPERTLQRRVQGRGSYYTRPPTHQRLDAAQEQSLFEYIERLDHIGMSPTPRMIQSSANTILRRGNLLAASLEKQWTTRFLKRNSRLHKRRQASLTAERKEAHDEENIKLHFRRYKAVCEAYGIAKKNRYNMDETGFRIGCGKSHTVITLESHKKLYMTDSGNRDYITSIECIDEDIDGFVVSAFLICAST